MPDRHRVRGLILASLMTVAVSMSSAAASAQDIAADCRRNPTPECEDLARRQLEAATEEMPIGETSDDDDLEAEEVDALDHPEIDPEFDGYSERWTGAFVGVGLFGGPTWTGTSELGSEVGWSLGVAARMNQVLSLFDLQLDYRFAAYDTTWRSETLIIEHHAFGAALGVHPLFLLNLGGDRFSYMLAAIYLQVGLSYDVNGIEYPVGRIDDSDEDVGINVGLGTDYPLTDPDAGGAIWAGVQYRFSKSTIDLAPFEGASLTEHLAALNVSYRHNGLIF